MAGWKGRFRVKGQTFDNEILSGGLSFLGGLFTGSQADRAAAIRLESADGQDSVTVSNTPTFEVSGNTLTVSLVATFSSAQMTFDAANAYLVSNQGVDISRADVVIPQGSAVEVTREDIFTVNA
jgi:hypothetical protein